MSPSTERSRLKRQPGRGTRDRSTIHAILDEALVVHVAVLDGGEPVVVPMTCARDGDRLLLHGSPASRLMRRLAEGAPACVTATLVDGLVLARSAFHHSLNYRSVVAHGRAVALEGAEAAEALGRLVDSVLPGRGAGCRPASDAEVRRTRIVAFPLDDATAKIRVGPPVDDAADLGLGHWAGVIPLATVAGEPLTADGVRVPVPEHVRALARRPSG